MKIKEFFSKNKNWLIAFVIIAIVSVGLALFINAHFDTSYRLKRAILFFCIGIFLYIIRPKSSIHKIKVETLTKLQKVVCALIALITIIIVVYPMSLNDVWSKPGWGHHTQYEDFTESLMRGHIYFDQFEVPQKLNEVDNPYDLHVRNKAKIDVRWDHAFYQGKYYMYFGIVPIIILFVPLKLVGISIIGSQATQIFSAFMIVRNIFTFLSNGKKAMSKDACISIYSNV